MPFPTKEFAAWKNSFLQRKSFCTMDRRPFYAVAGRYLPRDSEATVIDIGSGTGGFAEYLDLKTRFRHLHLLDGNPVTVERLKSGFPNVHHYEAPGRLPFETSSVDYIHCSHLIEHLDSDQCYRFLQESDRVLGVGGILAVSAPMLWQKFYDDLSHVRPYNPEMLQNYLVRDPGQRSGAPISDRYRILELVYRYRAHGVDTGWGSSLLPLDFLIKALAYCLHLIRIHRCEKNGYTLVLKKS